MTRYVSGDRVIYVERDWKLSVAFFLAALACAGFPLTLEGPDQREATGPAAAYGGMLVLGALLLLSSRAILIDPARGLCRIVERRSLTRTRRVEFALDGVRVRTSQGEEPGVLSPAAPRYYIWFDVPGRARIPFVGRLGSQEQLRERVLQLSRDLQIPGTPVG